MVMPLGHLCCHGKTISAGQGGDKSLRDADSPAQKRSVHSFTERQLGATQMHMALLLGRSAALRYAFRARSRMISLQDVGQGFCISAPSGLTDRRLSPGQARNPTTRPSSHVDCQDPASLLICQPVCLEAILSNWRHPHAERSGSGTGKRVW